MSKQWIAYRVSFPSEDGGGPAADRLSHGGFSTLEFVLKEKLRNSPKKGSGKLTETASIS